MSVSVCFFCYVNVCLSVLSIISVSVRLFCLLCQCLSVLYITSVSICLVCYVTICSCVLSCLPVCPVNVCFVLFLYKRLPVCLIFYICDCLAVFYPFFCFSVFVCFSFVSVCRSISVCFVYYGGDCLRVLSTTAVTVCVFCLLRRWLSACFVRLSFLFVSVHAFFCVISVDYLILFVVSFRPMSVPIRLLCRLRMPLSVRLLLYIMYLCLPVSFAFASGFVRQFLSFIAASVF